MSGIEGWLRFEGWSQFKGNNLITWQLLDVQGIAEDKDDKVPKNHIFKVSKVNIIITMKKLNKHLDIFVSLTVRP